VELTHSYEVLGVRRDASTAEIRDAYRALVKKWHPDRFADDPERQRLAEKRLTEINQAFARAKDSPSKPAPARSTRTSGAGGGGAAGPGSSGQQVAARRQALRERTERARIMAACSRRRWVKDSAPAFGAGVGAAASTMVAVLLASTFLFYPLAALALVGAWAAVLLGGRSARRYRELAELLRKSEHAVRCPHCGAPTAERLIDAPRALRRLAQTGRCKHCGRSHWLA